MNQRLFNSTTLSEYNLGYHVEYAGKAREAREQNLPTLARGFAKIARECLTRYYQTKEYGE